MARSPPKLTGPTMSRPTPQASARSWSTKQSLMTPLLDGKRGIGRKQGGQLSMEAHPPVAHNVGTLAAGNTSIHLPSQKKRRLKAVRRAAVRAQGVDLTCSIHDGNHGSPVGLEYRNQLARFNKIKCSPLANPNDLIPGLSGLAAAVGRQTSHPAC